MDGTYTTVKKLYNIAKNKKDGLKDSDKNEYLANTYSGCIKFFTGGILGDLLVDRMVAEIYKIISRKG